MKKLLNILIFMFMIAILFVSLKVINYLPSIIDGETLQRHRSIEEMKSAINVSHLYIPSYFPQGIEWPPSDILGQGKPFKAIVLKFRHGGSGDIAMVIYQVEMNRHITEEREVRITKVRERIQYNLKGREADLQVGACEDEEICSRISWTEDGFRVIISMKSTPFELLKIAESVIQ